MAETLPAVGVKVRLNNPHSVFHGAHGIIEAHIWPDMPNPGVRVCLLDAGGVQRRLVCHCDELDIVVGGDDE